MQAMNFSWDISTSIRVTMLEGGPALSGEPSTLKQYAHHEEDLAEQLRALDAGNARTFGVRQHTDE
jgi:hypothetical protein